VAAVAASPALCAAAKFGISFPLAYHFWGGLRHLAWDHATLGMQSYKKSIMEKATAPRTSYLVIGASVLTGAAMAVV